MYLGSSGELEPHRPAVDTDVLDELQVFVAYRPAWVGTDGFPLSWQHYQYGLTHIAREQLRHEVLMAQSFRMAQCERDDFDAWQRDMTRLTEVPR